MSNPFETYPNTFAEIYRKRHKCETVMLYTDDDLEASGEAKLNAEKKEHWVNEECAAGYCEYCHGWRYNEWFQEKPTNEEVNDMIMKQQLKCDMAKKVKRKKYMELRNGADINNGQLITLCIDKDYKQVPKLVGDIISVIIKTDYDCLLDAAATIELYGTNKLWNPHIHIATKKLKPNCAVAQLFRRKFVKDKYQVYRVDVKDLPMSAAMAYVGGHKDSPEKNEASEMDREYRNENSLEPIYDL